MSKQTETVTGFTPGPWRWDTQQDTVYSTDPDWDNSLICKIATGEDRNQENANAALIAASPIMFKELQAIAEASSNSDSYNALLSHCGKLARAALAQAQGKPI